MTGARDAESDASLVARSLGGDGRAFSAIVTRHKAALHRLATRLIGDEHEALDIVQESFVAAHRALARYDPARPLAPWLARITINKSRDAARRRKVRRMVSRLLPTLERPDQPDPAPLADAELAGRQGLRLAARAIEALPAGLREVLVLRAVEERSQREVAELLGISEKAVETRLYRARRTMKETVARLEGG